MRDEFMTDYVPTVPAAKESIAKLAVLSLDLKTMPCVAPGFLRIRSLQSESSC
jgi:hypothetical protein